tara:strand:+ start:358 stop:507 length:150 start_codon:yes stop_codon:yes gene_type:complete
MKSKGLGDTILKITIFLGIKYLVKVLYKENDCGCETRKDILNRWFPYKN